MCIDDVSSIWAKTNSRIDQFRGEFDYLHSASKYSSSCVSSRGNGGTGNELMRERLALMLSMDICRFRLIANGSLRRSASAVVVGWFVSFVSFSSWTLLLVKVKCWLWNWAIRLFNSRCVSSSRRRISAKVKPWYSSCQHQAWRCARKMVLRRAARQAEKRQSCKYNQRHHHYYG